MNDKTYGQDPAEPLGLSRDQRLQSKVNELIEGNGTGEPLGIINVPGQQIAEVPPTRRTVRNAEKRGRVIS